MPSDLAICDLTISPPTAIQSSNPNTQKSFLEDLPTELQWQILSNLNYEDIIALGRSSPCYLHLYLQNRKFFLYSGLEQEISIEEALATHHSSQPNGSNEKVSWDEQKIIHFLGPYQQMFCRQQTPDITSALYKEIKEHELEQLLLYHIKIVKPLMRRYQIWALKNLFNEVCHSLEQDGKPLTETTQGVQVQLSTTEDKRVIRALYRFQAICNIFGLGSQRPGTESSSYEDTNPFPDIGPPDIVELYFSIFEAWQAEELTCICRFIDYSYDKILDYICEDLRPGSPVSFGCPIGDRTYDLKRFRRKSHDLTILQKAF
jgi:hypothetical protein